MHNTFFIYIFLFRWKKRVWGLGGGGGGGSALNIFSIFYTHHRIPNKHMTTINFDTITNNYEVIYVIKTMMKYYLKKRYEFSSVSSKYDSTFICWRHYMTRFDLWIFMSKITHDFWLCGIPLIESCIRYNIMWQYAVGRGFLRVLWFSPPIKLTATI